MFIRSEAQKSYLFFILTTFNIPCGQQKNVVMNAKYVVMSRILYGTFACDISKHTFKRSGSSKKTLLFNFDHFKHSMWSFNSGIEC